MSKVRPKFEKIKFKKTKFKIEDYLGDSDTLVLSGWMINKLGLKGATLQVFASIHNYTQGKNGYFYGSQNYLARWSNTVKSNVNEILKKLVDDGLIEKIDDPEVTGSVQRVYYYSNVEPDKLIDGSENLEYYKNTYGKYAKTGNKSEPVLKEDQLEKNSAPDQKVDRACPDSGYNNITIDSNNSKNVVVMSANQINESIDEFDLEDIEKHYLSQKKEQDINTLVKYKYASYDIARILSCIANWKFRMMIAHYGDCEYLNKAETLLLDTLNLKRYRNRASLINSLSVDDVQYLYQEALNLFDYEISRFKKINITNEAYFIGIVDNCLDKKVFVVEGNFDNSTKENNYAEA